MKDIENRSDIDRILKVFYEKLFADPEINTIFLDVAHTDLDEHLPSLGDFWENLLFQSKFYNKNVMKIHQDLDAQYPFTQRHFGVWLGHFNDAIDENYHGELAQNMKDRAYSIAYVMRTKILKR